MVHLDRETVEIVVADSGHGISPEDKDAFSSALLDEGLRHPAWTRDCQPNHGQNINGSIRVEDNSPTLERDLSWSSGTEVLARILFAPHIG